MAEAHLTPIEIGLTAAIVAVEADEPRILVAADREERHPRRPAVRPVRSARRTAPSRSACATGWRQQTALDVGYVEQLYTFGDRGRHARPGDTGPHVVSVGYLALTRMSGQRRGAARSRRGFEPWYRFFPWEDWRDGRPEILDEVILPLLEQWAKSGKQPKPRGRSARRERLRHCFRRRRLAVGRREGARPLRAALRGGAGRGGARATAARPACRARSSPARRADALRPPPHPRDRDRAAARQAEIPPGGVRADAATNSR